ncbi:dynamin family protein [Leifsonia sp. YIM 134122]|uniref:Dynamin family protein n=1 Tax=Leifsonia stereocauli TaxID=3134136 RepID=A0ABU9W0K2_9MICO
MTDLAGARQRPLAAAKESVTGLLLTEAGTVLDPRGYGLELDEIRWKRKQLTESPARVVVVGELSAGKSSIVNALLGEPGFAPVGAKETTRVSLRFMPPSEELPAGVVRLDLDGEYRDVPRDELADWVTMSGAHAGTVEAEAVLGVDIGQQSAELPGTTIIDTPGSGGLSRSHAKRALTSAAGAGVLLIVTESDGRLTKKTLEFLRQAAEYAGWVIVAMNKIDQNPEWQQILDEDTVIMRDQQFPPAAFVGISALWAGKALTAEQDRDGLRRISRIDSLVAALNEPLGHAVRIPDVSALKQLHRLIEVAAADLAVGLVMIAEPEEASRQLAARQAELNEFREGQRHWRNRIGKGVHALKTDATNQTRKMIQDFEKEWHEKASSTFGKSKAQASDLQLEMTNDVKDMELSIADVMTVGIKRVIDELFTSAHLPVPEHLSVVDFEAIEKPNLRTVFESGGKMGLMAGGLSMGVMMARPGMILGSFLGPFALPVIAVGVAGGFMLSARMKNSRELQQRITDHTKVIREELADAIGQATSHLSLVVSEAFEDAVRDAQADIDAKIKDARQALTESAKDRSKRRIEHETSMKAYLELNGKALAELNRLRGNLRPLSGL